MAAAGRFRDPNPEDGRDPPFAAELLEPQMEGLRVGARRYHYLA